MVEDGEGGGGDGGGEIFDGRRFVLRTVLNMALKIVLSGGGGGTTVTVGAGGGTTVTGGAGGSTGGCIDGVTGCIYVGFCLLFRFLFL